ncbi:MAG: zinc ribbon domain-containing protein [candidate division WS1 bacterium]|nr:zinc ribbon domain-containing protein [candidate division WS1 bacterium]
MALIEFTDNYEDLSTDVGFQFKFLCERCGNGYMSEFQSFTAGKAMGFLRAATSLLGRGHGVVDSAYEIQRAVGGPAHDNALKLAIAEVRPHFHQCSRCGEWVCDVCWNARVSLCEQCAPDTQEELAAMQQEARLDQLRDRVNDTDYTSEINVKDEAVAFCPHCGAKATGGKFCNECGKPLAAASVCSECGSENPSGARFCSECGGKLG